MVPDPIFSGHRLSSLRRARSTTAAVQFVLRSAASTSFSVRNALERIRGLEGERFEASSRKSRKILAEVAWVVAVFGAVPLGELGRKQGIGSFFRFSASQRSAPERFGLALFFLATLRFRLLYFFRAFQCGKTSLFGSLCCFGSTTLRFLSLCIVDCRLVFRRIRLSWAGGMKFSIGRRSTGRLELQIEDLLRRLLDERSVGIRHEVSFESFLVGRALDSFPRKSILASATLLALTPDQCRELPRRLGDVTTGRIAVQIALYRYLGSTADGIFPALVVRRGIASAECLLTLDARCQLVRGFPRSLSLLCRGDDGLRFSRQRPIRKTAKILAPHDGIVTLAHSPPD